MSSHEHEDQTDEAWREIVANYGARADVEPDAVADAPSPVPAPKPVHEEPVDDGPSYLDHLDDIAEVDRFRPPPAPPVPLPRTWQRGLAWLGITVVPLVALVVTLLRWSVPNPLGWLMVLWGIGGFVYLTMVAPRTPRDPWDDGSRI